MPQVASDEPEPSLALSTVRRVRSRSVSSRVTPSSASGDAERVLPNGDIYTGGFAGGVPHGAGKYLWKDGCMYEGEWRRGKAAGKGKFSWPSGATYEGEFQAGRMEGLGSFIGSDGQSYFGFWIADRKHGFGQKSYANGDFYEGMWRRNLQEGQGRYVWQSGNEYSGQWRNGVISGRGVLKWANGNRYEGQWENGVPKGSGVFSWPDGSYYVGSWSKDPNFGLNGTFYSAKEVKERTNPLLLPLEEGRIQFLTRKRLSASGALPGRQCGRNISGICIWESDGEAGDITCDIIGNVEATSQRYRNEMGLVLAKSRRRPCCSRGELKKPGQIMSKGHKHYELMRNLQLGIRYSFGKDISVQMRDIKHSDFDPREKFWMRFPPEGSKVTPPHPSPEFRWKDYCPMVFRHLRKLFTVDPEEYTLSICGNAALRVLASPGKSGSFFYLTEDDRFMIKTVKKCEVKVLLRMLPSYYEHVSQYENSLITRFFGLHCVKSAGGQKVRFIVMGNLFCSEYHIHRRFDLKGSSHGRTIDKSEGEIDETTTLKDLDLNFVFHLQGLWHQDLLRQLERDCEFLEAEGIMDYSLLVGVHFCDDVYVEEMGMHPFLPSSRRETFQGDKGVSGCCFCDSRGHNMDRILSSRKPLIRLGANMPARAEKVIRNSDHNQYQPHPSSGGELMWVHGNDYHEVILFFGIIDILQDYDISKKLEHVYRSLHTNPNSISAVDPKLYAKRFRDFINGIFKEELQTANR